MEFVEKKFILKDDFCFVLSFVLCSYYRAHLLHPGLFSFSFFVSDLFGSVKMAELRPVWEKAADSACHL